MSSKGFDVCNEVRVSQSGNEIFVFGNFGDSLSVASQTLVPPSSQNPFIIKYDTSGTVLWYSQINGSEVIIENAALAANGDIVIEGRFMGSIDFGSVVYLNQSVNNDIHSTFVARMTNSGAPLWIKIFPDSGYGNIALSEDGHVYFVRESFPEGLFVLRESWIHHLDTTGEVIWEEKWVSVVYPAEAYAQDIAVSNGQVILGFNYFGNIEISNTVLSAPSGLGFAAVKFNTEGKLKWLKNLGIATYLNAGISDIIVHDDGGFYLSGGLPNQAMLARYDSIGNMIWQKRTPAGDSFGWGYLSKDAEGHIYFAAEFFNSPEFEGYQLRGTNDTQFIFNAPNIVVGKLSSSGVLLSLNQFEPSTLNAVASVALGSNHDFYVGGFTDAFPLRIEELALPTKNDDGFARGDGFLVKLTFKNQVDDPVIPTLDLGADVLLCKNESFMLDPKGFVHYTWQDNSTSPTFMVTKPGVYSVFVIDQFGNESRDTVRVTACEKPEVFIPNVITPNHDTSNEFFKITGIDTTLNNTLTVYNRWGEVVYHENSYQSNWDASSLSAGVYFYRFYDAATNQEYKGSLHVVK